MTTTLWANLVFGVHLGYAVFVVLGFAAVFLGWLLNWQWIRWRWIRITHVVAIAIVAFQAVLGLACPLTVLEYDLRGLIGDPVEEHFIGRLMSGLFLYEIPNWVFTTLYVAITALAIALLRAIPTQGRVFTKPNGRSSIAGSDEKRLPGRKS